MAHKNVESDRRRYVHQVRTAGSESSGPAPGLRAQTALHGGASVTHNACAAPRAARRVQVKALQRELSIIQDNHEVMVTAYTQPVIYPPHGVLSPTSPSQHAARAARRKAAIAALLPADLDKPQQQPSDASLAGVGASSGSIVSAALPPASPSAGKPHGRSLSPAARRQALHPDVVRAVPGPAGSRGSRCLRWWPTRRAPAWPATATPGRGTGARRRCRRRGGGNPRRRRGCRW